MSESESAFGEWLRGEMERLGYMQRGDMSKFARSCGVHVSILWRAINEGKIPTPDVLRRIGGALGYTLGDMLVYAGVATRDELFVGPPREREVKVVVLPPRQPRYADPGEQQVWEADSLTSQQRRMLIDFLRLIRKYE